jgi:heme/copper-type cytochrome/quinol oxidase subunit 4
MLQLRVSVQLWLFLSLQEKLAAGAFIAACIFATPVWVVTHMNDYRTLEKK